MRGKFIIISFLFLFLLAYPVYGLYLTDSGEQENVKQVDSSSTSVNSEESKRMQPVYKEGEVLVKFRKGVTSKDTKIMASSYVMSEAKKFTLLSQKRRQVYLLLKSQKMTTEDMVAVLKKDPSVEAVSPNYIRKICKTPNDPRFDQLWGLHNTGQTGGTPDADINATEAWDVNTGSSDVVVAVIDTGVDYSHEDLAGNMWTNDAEATGEADVDDDGNGYVDDIYGYDFASDNEGNNDSDPMDIHGHGTHVSGTIAAVGNNSIGVVGVNWTAQIMALKIMTPEGYLYLSDIIEAIEYIVQMKTNYGVNVVAINASFGGIFPSEVAKDAVEFAGDAGILFVAAAGNDGDAIPFYPCAYDSKNIICVAATDHNDELAGFSNYGFTTVDLAAPGVDIKSTVPFGMGTEAYVKVNSTTYQAIGMRYAGQTDEDGITGLVYDCGLGYPDDFPPGISGYIALIERGELYFAEKTTHAKDAGAVAVIIYNNEPGNVSGTLGDPGDWIPVVSISQEDGQDLINNQSLPRTVTLVNKPSNYSTMSGTSMATPHVTGLSGLISAHYPSISYLGIKDRIFRTVDKKSYLEDYLAFGGRINAYNSLTANIQEPFIYSLSPPAASYGYEITIEGAQFGENRGEGKVTFSDNITASIISWGNYEIVCTVPQGCQSGPVTVTIDEGLESNERIFDLSGSISGKVTEEQTGNGIEEIKVYVYDSSGSGAGSGYTDSNGNYAVWGLETGNYYVRTSNDQGYFDEWYEASVAKEVPVSIPHDTPDIDFALEMGATIRGTVTECDTNPLLAAEDVRVYAKEWDTGGTMASDRTDSDGHYTLGGLPTGKYRICVDTYNTKYMEMCDDTPVEVTEGNDYDEHNLCLERGATIRGVVTECGTDPPLAVKDVVVEAVEWDTDKTIDSDRTDSEGHYTLQGLPTGKYWICVDTYNTKYMEMCHDTPVEVTEGDEYELDLCLKVGATIRGVVTECESDPPLVVYDVRVYAKDWDMGRTMASDRSDSEGRYTLQGLPTGKYRICVYDAKYIEMCDDTPAEVIAGNYYHLNLCLEVRGTATIKGVITECESDPPLAVGDVRVYAKDWDTGGTMASDRTDSEGHYTLQGLPPGKYQICVDNYGTKYMEMCDDTPFEVIAGDDKERNLCLGVGATIRGTVTECDTSPPIGVEGVEVYAKDWDTGKRMTSDRSYCGGHYILQGLPPGNYRICVDNYAKYMEMCHDTPVEVTAGDDKERNLCLEVGATIKGFVTECGTSPPLAIEDVSVYAEDWDTGKTMDSGRTDFEGHYTLQGLPPGKYRICVDNYGTKYMEMCDDTPVLVIAGDDKERNLCLEVGATIRGVVTECESNPPLAIDDVWVYAEDWDSGEEMASDRSYYGGYYTLQRLPTGKYRICMDTRYTKYIRKCDDTPVDVIAGEEDERNLCLEAGGSISGKVTLETSGESIEGVRLEVYDSNGKYFNYDYTDSNGDYIFVWLETGNYYVCTSNDQGYIDQWYGDANPGRGDPAPVYVDAPKDTPNINFALVLLEEDSYEDDNTCSQANFIDTDGTSQDHTLYPAGDVDWLKFDVSNEVVCIIETFDMSPECYTNLYLYDTDCLTLLYRSASMIEYHFSSPGTYYVKVKHLWDSGTGAYKIEVSASTTTSTTTSSSTTSTTIKPPMCIVTVTPDGETVTFNQTLQFSAITECNGDDMTPDSYTWYVSGSAGGTIDSNGLYTAGETEGTDTVHAMDEVNGVEGTAMVVVESGKVITVSPSEVKRSRWVPLFWLMYIKGTGTNFAIFETPVVYDSKSVLKLPALVLSPTDIYQIILIMPSILTGIGFDGSSETVTVTVDGVSDAFEIIMLPAPFDEEKNLM